MPKFFVRQNQVDDGKIVINGQDVKHIRNVLRAKVGEELEICNSETGENFLCSILEFNEDKIWCNIEQKIQEETESNVKVTIFQGLPKADKMEYIIQKSVELGVYDITPVDMKRCVVKLDEKNSNKKIERWQKISEVAAKQCGRNIIPQINNVINIKKLCEIVENYDIVLVAYENEENNSLKNELSQIKSTIINNQSQELKIGIVIGPEGGLEKQDVENLKRSGAKIITLGKRILRTETVALNVLSIIMYELEN